MTWPSKNFLVIVFGSIGLACALGIALDMVTAHVAVEYFSVYHPRIISSQRPFDLALAWGIAASWWFGAVVGLVLAFFNGRRQQPMSAPRILKWVAVWCAVLWLVMMAILVGVMVASSTIPVHKRRPTFENDRRVIAVAMAHQYEYLLGGIALIILTTWVVRAKPITSVSLEPVVSSTNANRASESPS
jgi:hypothetical protein